MTPPPLRLRRFPLFRPPAPPSALTVQTVVTAAVMVIKWAPKTIMLASACQGGGNGEIGVRQAGVRERGCPFFWVCAVGARERRRFWHQRAIGLFPRLVIRGRCGRRRHQLDVLELGGDRGAFGLQHVLQLHRHIRNRGSARDVRRLGYRRIPSRKAAAFTSIFRVTRTHRRTSARMLSSPRLSRPIS